MLYLLPKKLTILISFESTNKGGALEIHNTRTTTKTLVHPLVEFMYLVFTCTPGEIYHRQLRSLLLYLFTYFECKLTPLWVDSAQALWASFCFRFFSFAQILSPPFICFVGEYLTQVFMWACEIKLVINPACCKPVHKIVSCSVNMSLLVI